MTECRMTKEFRNDETSRGVVRISTFARMGGENSRLQLEGAIK
jgi:hypothetical protein